MLFQPLDWFYWSLRLYLIMKLLKSWFQLKCTHFKSKYMHCTLTCVFHFKMHKTAYFHSNLLVSWELVTEGYQWRPLKCGHFKWNMHISCILCWNLRISSKDLCGNSLVGILGLEVQLWYWITLILITLNHNARHNVKL